MINKSEILNYLRKLVEEFDLPPNSIQVLGGASLVLRGLKEECADVDLCMSAYICKKLVKSGQFKDVYVKNNSHSASVENMVFDIRDTKYDCDVMYGEFHIQSLQSLLKLKLKLNRSKDQNDIVIIKNALESHAVN